MIMRNEGNIRKKVKEKLREQQFSKEAEQYEEKEKNKRRK